MNVASAYLSNLHILYKFMCSYVHEHDLNNFIHMQESQLKKRPSVEEASLPKKRQRTEGSSEPRKG